MGPPNNTKECPKNVVYKKLTCDLRKFPSELQETWEESLSKLQSRNGKMKKQNGGPNLFLVKYTPSGLEYKKQKKNHTY